MVALCRIDFLISVCFLSNSICKSGKKIDNVLIIKAQEGAKYHGNDNLVAN